MRILMLGNSYTFTNDLPGVLGERLGATVVSNTRGGAHLAEQLNPETAMGQKTLQDLQAPWDYVILQEQSKAPMVSREAYLKSVAAICRRIGNATPVIYATWAYTGEPLAKTGMTYEEMAEALHKSFVKAAADNRALLADVGTAFLQAEHREQLYKEDGSHPSPEGTALAADVICRCISEKKSVQISENVI